MGESWRNPVRLVPLPHGAGAWRDQTYQGKPVVTCMAGESGAPILDHAITVTFLVHGEKEVIEHFAEKLSGTQVDMPTLHQEYLL